MEQQTATVSTSIDATPAEVWAALTKPELVKKYFFGSDLETDWEEGHPIRFSGDYKGKHYEDKGEVLKFEPEKRLSFTHWSSMSGKPDKPENCHRVEYELEPISEGTKVTIRQETKGGDKGRAESEKNWTTVLTGLKKVVEH